MCQLVTNLQSLGVDSSNVLELSASLLMSPKTRKVSVGNFQRVKHEMIISTL